MTEMKQLAKRVKELQEEIKKTQHLADVRCDQAVENYQKWHITNREKIDLEIKVEELENKIADLEWQLQEVAKDNDYYQAENKRLQEQIEKLLDWISENSICCDFCPMTVTCINDEGTCPYASELQKDETKTTKEWARQKLLKE